MTQENPYELTPAKEAYLRERGFYLIYRQPSESTKYPYLELGANDIGPAVYKPVQGVSSFSSANLSMPIDEAVNYLALTVSTAMSLEGKTFTTTLGKPIKVYVSEDAWKEIAKTLARKYSPKKPKQQKR